MQQEVIIVGGGMVGLSLALMLAKQNIAVKLLEAIKYPNYDDVNLAPYHSSFDARNSALSRRTVQIYQELGLWSALQEHATPILEVNITEQGSFGKARLKAEQEKSRKLRTGHRKRMARSCTTDGSSEETIH